MYVLLILTVHNIHVPQDCYIFKHTILEKNPETIEHSNNVVFFLVLTQKKRDDANMIHRSLFDKLGTATISDTFLFL